MKTFYLVGVEAWSCHYKYDTLHAYIKWKAHDEAGTMHTVRANCVK
jgi:hypothetical protein